MNPSAAVAAPRNANEPATPSELVTTITAVNAYIDVPTSGSDTVHAGFEDSTYSVVALEGDFAIDMMTGTWMCESVSLESLSVSVRWPGFSQVSRT
jgi:hypothetical protein